MSKSIIECVPNFSEGRDANKITAIADVIRSVKGVRLLHIDVGEAANRTVMTFVGTPENVTNAAFEAIKKASELIDMQIQTGEHPRIGATDVCPLIPIANISLEEVTLYAKALAERVGAELKIPVYLYEAAATQASRKNLANIRKGEYEGLAEKMKLPNWQPDFGNAIFNARSGASVIGARKFLIAYNVNLNTEKEEIAKEIAAEIRASGKVIIENGVKKRIKGKCQALKAIGWYIQEYQKAQVSMNLIDFQLTGMHEAFESCKTAAQKHGTRVTGSELIGLVPLQAMIAAGRFYAPTETGETELIQIAIERLGLNELEYFDPNERIVEYAMRK